MPRKKNISKTLEKSLNKYFKILEDEGIPISKAYLYGSYANNTTNKNSDIDICIISSKFADSYDYENQLWIKTMEVDTRIEPVGFAPQDFKEENPLAYQILSSGIQIK